MTLAEGELGPDGVDVARKGEVAAADECRVAEAKQETAAVIPSTVKKHSRNT